MDNKEAWTKSPIIYVFCAALSFVCITICSKFSFLYAFHDVADVQCFITTARCMQRGDVLYRDVYEHKGPLHYFLYCLGLGATGGSTIGVYLIEIVLFSVFLFIVYKTVELFCKYAFFNYAITTIIGVWATVRGAFCGGGECEELTLPFVAIALYLVLKESAGDFFASFGEKEAIKQKDTEPNTWRNAVVVGLCFAIVFWSKYTITGVFAGYVFALLTIGIVNKDMKYVAQRAMGFICGTIIGSIPVIIYFGINRAFSDLWEAYFYNLIFKYSQNDYGETVFVQNLKSMVNIGVIVAIVGVIAAPKRILKKEGKLFVIFMLALSLIGLSVGKVWNYVREAVVPFAVLAFVGVIGIIGRVMCSQKVRRSVEHLWLALTDRLGKELEEKERLKNGLQKAFVDRKQLTVSVLLVIFVIYAAYFSFTTVPTSDAIGAAPEEYVIVRVSEKIEELQPGKPIILNFTSLDTGLYYLTETYPPDKYFCSYNLFSPRVLGYYEKYLVPGKADFVIAHKPIDDLDKYGYSLCYEEENVSTVNRNISVSIQSYYLYAREDLIK